MDLYTEGSVEGSTVILKNGLCLTTGDAISILNSQHALLNLPELHDFSQGVVLEAAHQRQRWGLLHDREKTPLDWFWLIGYLAQKVVVALGVDDVEKAKHHTISTAATLNNWHAAISSDNTQPQIKRGEL